MRGSASSPHPKHESPVGSGRTALTSVPVEPPAASTPSDPHTGDRHTTSEGARLRRSPLKAILIATDAAMLLSGIAIALWASGYQSRSTVTSTMLLLATGTAIGLVAVRSQGLMLGRVSIVRLLEMTRLMRASFILGFALLVVDRFVPVRVQVRDAAAVALVTAMALMIGRSSYRQWIGTARKRGRFSRPVVVLGADEEARRLIELFDTHQDLGLHVVGVIGRRTDAFQNGLIHQLIGSVDDAEDAIARSGASGVVIVAGAVPAPRLTSLVRHLHAADVHVHLATGVSGIDGRRLRSVPIAHEPLLYVEPVSLGRLQGVAKRLLDVLVASIAIVLTSPLMILVAIAIKLDDGGPVLFRQERVGRRGRRFGLRKFRSMHVDAETQLAALASANERRGPLFKMTDDPRVTRLGGFLRESSLDELSQLFNVLAGNMSLVGPRPALPAEVELFPESLRERERVLPGLTGLWQVEARDNPSFEAYRRLDLFYVENWSITLDLLIVVGTLEQVIGRVVTALSGRVRRRDPVMTQETASLRHERWSR